MMWDSILDDYVSSWLLSGRSLKTVLEYRRYQSRFIEWSANLEFGSAVEWLLIMPSNSTRRQAARALRSLGKYLEALQIQELTWWRHVPLTQEKPTPQATVVVDDYRQAKVLDLSIRDRAIVEVLWSTGLRRSELSRLTVVDLHVTKRAVLVRSPKNGKPRVVPLSDVAFAAVRAHIGERTEGSIFGMSSAGVAAMLKRHGLPSAHAWRRGWAVESLRRGVSEASVRTAAGWSTGAMVVRYTAALSQEIAIEEFRRSWDLIS